MWLREAPPSQFSGSEGVPPLPLPAVPLRRTEKKNPPRPPVLIAKIATASRADWATNPGDADNLLRWMAEQLKVNFSAINLNHQFQDVTYWDEDQIRARTEALLTLALQIWPHPGCESAPPVNEDDE